MDASCGRSCREGEAPVLSLVNVPQQFSIKCFTGNWNCDSQNLHNIIHKKYSNDIQQWNPFTADTIGTHETVLISGVVCTQLPQLGH